MEKKNNSFEEIWTKIKEAKNIIMTLHPRPDGDSLGACCAMKYVLERDFGKKIKIVSKDPLDEIIGDLDFAKEVEFGRGLEDLNLEEFDLILALDIAEKDRLFSREGRDTSLGDLEIVNIDHHDTNSGYGDFNYIDAKKASVCNILVKMFRTLGIKFDRELGKRLMLGIVNDTVFFTGDLDIENSFRDVVFLFDVGTRYVEDILKPVKYNIPFKKFKTVALMIDNMRVGEVRGSKYGYTVIDYESFKNLELTPTEVRGNINELMYIKEFDFIFMLADLGDFIKGSFRSKKGVDVSLFAKELGGGGHEFASAFTLDKMSLEDAVDLVRNAIEKVGVHKVEEKA